MQQIGQIGKGINLTYTKGKVHSKLIICLFGTRHFGNVCCVDALSGRIQLPLASTKGKELNENIYVCCV